MEITIEPPADEAMRRALMFDPRFHDTDRLVGALRPAMVEHHELNGVAEAIQRSVQANDAAGLRAAPVRATAEPAPSASRWAISTWRS